MTSLWSIEYMFNNEMWSFQMYGTKEEAETLSLNLDLGEPELLNENMPIEFVLHNGVAH